MVDKKKVTELAALMAPLLKGMDADAQADLVVLAALEACDDLHIIDLGNAAERNIVVDEVETYFVKDGLLNGEDGVSATPCGGGDDPPQKDGWYYILDGMDDGVGPYPSKEAAEEAGKEEASDVEDANVAPYPPPPN